MKNSSLPIAASSSEFVKNKRPALLLVQSSCSRPGSCMGTTPVSSIRSLTGSASTHTTVLPISANPPAETSPTYPAPIIVIFTCDFLLRIIAEPMTTRHVIVPRRGVDAELLVASLMAPQNCGELSQVLHRRNMVPGAGLEPAWTDQRPRDFKH